MIIGTAGHIDHGKTSLIKALTGVDTDRLREERERGMSIDLGFTCLDIPNGIRAGVIDVPGHEGFIRNMVAGAHGMDIVLFSVAADDGVMPQTREHLDIICLLGISKGIGVITKADAVDRTRVEEVREEVSRLLEGGPLVKAPVVAVSSLTGEGIGDLKKRIEELSSDLKESEQEGFFRMPVDRSFTVKGFGTVVTGTVISGKISAGESLRFFPGGIELRARRLEVHSTERKSIAAGCRAAINIPGVGKDEIKRGDVLTSLEITSDTMRFDASLQPSIFSGKEIRRGERVHLHIGTADVIATCFPVSSSGIAPHGEACVTFSLSRPLQIMRGDRFVVRDYSAQTTIAGGVVLNPFSPKVRGKDAGDYFRLWKRGDTPAMAEDILKRNRGWCSVKNIAENLNIVPGRLREALKGSDRLRLTGDAVLMEDILKSAGKEIADKLRSHHDKRPSEAGMEIETLRKGISTSLPPLFFKEVIDRLAEEEIIDRDGDILKLKGSGIKLTAEEIKGRMDIMRLLEEKSFQTVSEAVLAGGDRKKMGVLRSMARSGEIVQVSKNNYISRRILEGARQLLLLYFEKSESITVAQFRDILGTGRKGGILILEHFDSTGLTLRRGDERVLMKKPGY